jgi:hypothetical protein
VYISSSLASLPQTFCSPFSLAALYRGSSLSCCLSISLPRICNLLHRILLIVSYSPRLLHAVSPFVPPSSSTLSSSPTLRLFLVSRFSLLSTSHRRICPLQNLTPRTLPRRCAPPSHSPCSAVTSSPLLARHSRRHLWPGARALSASQLTSSPTSSVHVQSKSTA